MRKTVAGFWWSPTIEGTPALTVVATFFLLGSLTGCLMAFRANASGTEVLHAYIEHFWSLAQEGNLAAPGLPSLLWRTLRWPLAAFLLSFSAVGLIGMPVLTCIRGFLLSFSVASFSRALGHSGFIASVFLQGVPNLLAVPAFLLFATQGFSASCSYTKRGNGQGKRGSLYNREHFLRYVFCATTFLVSLLAERYLIPILIMGWAKH